MRAVYSRSSFALLSYGVTSAAYQLPVDYVIDILEMVGQKKSLITEKD